MLPIKEMTEFLKKLFTLQNKDSEIDLISDEIDTIPQKIEELQKEIKDLEEELKQKDEEFKKHAIHQKELENELLKIEEEIKKEQMELYSVKTNEMYKSLKQNIEDKKKRKSEIEDEILVIMDKIDEEKQKLSEFKKDLEAKKSQINNNIKELENRKKELSEKLENLKMEREGFVSEICSTEEGSKYYAKYEKIRKSKNGVAVVNVIENACGGCNISLTKEKINEVLTSDFPVCDNCGRILFLEKKDESS